MGFASDSLFGVTGVGDVVVVYDGSDSSGAYADVVAVAWDAAAWDSAAASCAGA